MMNRMQAEALFESKAFLFEGRDVIIDDDAIELIGKAAVKHAHENDELFDVQPGVRAVRYLTKKGFLDACSYANILELRDRK